MNKNTPYAKGEKLVLFTKNEEENISLRVVLERLEPFIVEVLDPLLDIDLQSLYGVKLLILAHPEQNSAFRVKVVGIKGGRVALEIIARYEARQFFRADAMISLGYELIESRRHRAGGGDDEETGRDFTAWFDDVRGKTKIDKSLANLIQSMQQEIRLLRSQISRTQASTSEPMTSRNVSLSGSGVRFPIESELQAGDIVQVQMQFTPGSRTIHTQAKVVRTEIELKRLSGAAAKLAVACHFIDISNMDREEVIKHVFQAQRKAIRKRWAR